MIIIVVLSLMINNSFMARGTPTNSSDGLNFTSSKNQPSDSDGRAELFLIKEYGAKICRGESTCHLTEQVPPSLTTLSTRRCMCDAKCSKYGDCCLDSPYYNETEQRVNYKQFYCLSTFRLSVYAIVTCPPTYSNEKVKFKCHLSTASVNNNTRIMTPVTDIQSGITYGNEYCALCNGVTNFQVWDILFNCLAKTSSEDGIDSLEAVIHPNFDPVMNKFITIYNGTQFLCDEGVMKKPQNVTVRDCIEGISTCPPGVENKLCESQTAFGYISNGSLHKSYKNKYCAECNGETGIFEPCIEIYREQSSHVGFSVVFKITEVLMNADTDGCGSLKAGENTKKTFCSGAVQGPIRSGTKYFYLIAVFGIIISMRK